MFRGIPAPLRTGVCWSVCEAEGASRLWCRLSRPPRPVIDAFGDGIPQQTQVANPGRCVGPGPEYLSSKPGTGWCEVITSQLEQLAVVIATLPKAIQQACALVQLIRPEADEQVVAAEVALLNQAQGLRRSWAEVGCDLQARGASSPSRGMD